MSSDDIRKSIALIKSYDNPKVEEAAPMGFFKMLSTAAAAMFSDVALGKLDTGKAANRTYMSYLKYLGTIGKKADQGTVGDLYSFLAKSGSQQKALMTGLRIGTKLPINNEADIKKYWDTVIKTKDKVSNTILTYVQEMSKKPAQELEPQDFAKQAQAGNVSVAKIEKIKAKEIDKKASAETPKAVPMDDIEKSIKDVIGSQNVAKQVSSIDAALKALGE